MFETKTGRVQPHAVRPVSGMNPEFNRFLLAPVDENKNGALLSVLSALARLDIDPWQEAANLSGLPRDKATQRLAALIGGLTDAASESRNPETVAERLIPLLPHMDRSKLPPQENQPKAHALVISKKLGLIVFLLTMLVMGIVSQYVASTQPSASTETGQGTSHPKIPAPVSPPKH